MVPDGSSNSATSTSATMDPQLNQTNNGHTTGTSDNTFGSYQLLAVGTSDRTIRVPIPLPMSQLPYCKVMVVGLFFSTIKGLATDSTLSSVDLVSTIVGYFDFNISSVEEEGMVAAKKNRTAIFKLEKITGLGFRNHKGGSVSFDPNDTRPADLTHFAFRSEFWASSIDN